MASGTVCALGDPTGDDTDNDTTNPTLNVDWPASPTPITLSDFEVGITPRGRLISWSAAGELMSRGYRVQARPRGGAWAYVSPLIPSERAGPEGAFYVWHHRGAAPGTEYRVVEINHDGMEISIDASDPDVGRRARR